MADDGQAAARHHGRRLKHGAERQRQIGAEMLLARPRQVPWKVLEKRYGLKRARLQQLMREAARAKRSIEP